MLLAPFNNLSYGNHRWSLIREPNLPHDPWWPRPSPGLPASSLGSVQFSLPCRPWSADAVKPALNPQYNQAKVQFLSLALPFTTDGTLPGSSAPVPPTTQHCQGQPPAYSILSGLCLSLPDFSDSFGSPQVLSHSELPQPFKFPPTQSALFPLFPLGEVPTSPPS